MTPVTSSKDAKESGFSQVREAIQELEGDVESITFDQWGGKLVDDDGKPVPPKEFCEVKLLNCKVIRSSEELAMDVDGKEFSFRINCSDFRGSFWIDKFLASVDKLGIIFPDGIQKKRVTFVKDTLLGRKDPKFNKTNFVLSKVAEISKTGTPAPAATPTPSAAAPAAPATPATPAPAAPAAAKPAEVDPVAIVCELAHGKTDAQFRSAISLDPRMVGNPLLTMVKSGALMEALVKDGKLSIVKDGNKSIYQKL